MDYKEELKLLKESVSIIEVAQQYGPIKRKGRYVFTRCLCKQHRDSDPSVHLRPDKNDFYCFICRKGGSVIDAIMFAEGCDFKTAVEKLRTYYHAGYLAKTPIINIGAYALEPQPEQITSPEIAHVLDLAAELFHEQLRSSAQAREYLRSRRIGDETIERFKIGWAPYDFPIVNLMHRRFGVNPNDVYQAGLVDDKWNIVFRNRIVFPIYTIGESGHPMTVYMIGRRIRDAKTSNSPKYLGLPNRKAFKNVFALNVPVKRASIIVEGIVDAIALAQAGLDADFSIIALLGLGSERGISSLLRLGVLDNPAYLFLDNDEAGRKAIAKLLEAFSLRGQYPFLMAQGENAPVVESPYPYSLFKTSLSFKDAGELLEKGTIDVLAREIREHFDKNVAQAATAAPEQGETPSAIADAIRRRWRDLGLR